MNPTSSDEIISRLKHQYPFESCREHPFRSLISTILSQRTRTETTHRAAEALFKKYDTPQKINDADIEDIEELIRPSGFYHIKARRIRSVCRQLLERHEGRVPDTLEDLLSLEGVGRKTANCVLVYGFGKSAIPVDVHVHRIANRLGLVSTTSPRGTETELMRIIPPGDWIMLNHSLVALGREICTPLNPDCERCFLSDACDTGREKTQENLL
jgi:endonuclease-3